MTFGCEGYLRVMNGQSHKIKDISRQPYRALAAGLDSANMYM